MTRNIMIAGLANARDLGGLKRRDGTVTPSGVFIRAEAPDRVDDSGWDDLYSYGVRTVVDLRRPEEITGTVPQRIDHVRVDLDGDESEFWHEYESDGRWGTPLYYLAHLDALPHRLGAVLRAVREAGDGVILFHCAAGWDRTGLLAAVLLRALDVTEEAAVADYLLSFANAEDMAALHERSFDVEERLLILERFGHTPESAFREAYANLDLGRWFDDAGVDQGTRASIETWRGNINLRSA